MEKNLLYKLKRIDHLIIQMMFKINDNNVPNRPPSRTQAQILEILINSKKPITQKEIEEKLNVSRATISETLSKMEKYEMIKREISESDSRIKIIKLTEKSIETHKKMDKTMKLISDKVNNILAENELKELNKLLEKLIIGIENESNKLNNIGGKDV